MTLTRLRLLLVEDDTVSAAFLGEALASLPAQVDLAGSLAQASEMARSQAHDLWLVDANLPDGTGEQWLQARRAAGDATPALALSAGLERERLDALEAAGALEVLAKPIAVAALLSAVRRALGQPPQARPAPEPGKLPCWDEAAALSALGGDRVALAALRRLFLDELPGQGDAVRAACETGDDDALRAVLHRLQAGAGFVGAARLLALARRLSADPAGTGLLQAFEEAVQDALASAPTPAPAAGSLPGQP